ncbi:MAG: sialidase family protein [Verrucomicrobiota bacterium]
MSLRRTLSLLLLSATALTAFATPTETDVWVADTDGYHTYRIPAIVRSRDNTLLAFAEGRRAGRGDAGDIDLLVKRSKDGGKTWGKQILVWDDATNTAGNPCPVVDLKTGTIWMLSTHNLETDKETDIINKRSKSTRTVWVLRSDDDGLTWSKATEITATTKDPSWGWYATGPGMGIQLQKGPHAGRLVIPANHSFDDPNGNLRGGKYSHRAHAIYSDDAGKTWKLGGTTGANTNESQLVELAEPAGGVLINMRSYFGRAQRTHSISRDGGITWTAPADQPELIEPVCQASIVRQSFPQAGKPGLILFSNPADPKARVNLTVRGSTDDAKTWPTKLVLTPGPSAYSCLVSIDANTAGCLYERGEKGPYEKIVFARFAPSDLK